ncbi:hypothetical protein [Rhizobium sp. 11515TR]|uniref:hypothetical protein n=1 Tax=Rhizobium sp. 11515TR TaxID=2028343 RepID=UPI0011B5BD1B|nr:hypothetical protein [Rhizobium sp. 11515TR]
MIISNATHRSDYGAGINLVGDMACSTPKAWGRRWVFGRSKPRHSLHFTAAFCHRPFKIPSNLRSLRSKKGLTTPRPRNSTCQRAQMPGIDPSFIIAAMLQRRNGIDMISKAYEQTTVYAKPDRLTRKQPSFSNDNAGQNLLSGEPDIDWDSAYPETGAAARKIALRNKPGTKPVEHRKSIVTNRVQAIDPNTNTRLRLESSLEHDAMIMFMADPKVVAIQAQFGPVWFKREDVWHKHYFDLCVDYASGCRGLFAVRHQKKAAEVEHDLELIRSHDLRNHAHFARVLTEKIITRPAVYSASCQYRSNTPH